VDLKTIWAQNCESEYYAHRHSILRQRITWTPTAIIHRNNICPFARVLATTCRRMLSERTVKADFPSSSSSGIEPLRRAGFVPTTYAYFKVSTRSGSSTPYFTFLFPGGVKLSVNQADHLPPSSTEVKNEWSRTSTPLIYLHGVDTDNFAFAFYASITRIDFHKISSYKCHTEHPLDTTILYGIKNSIMTLGSSESNRLSDLYEMSMQSILSHLTTPHSVMQQAYDLIYTSNLHHIGFSEFTIIFAFCFRRSDYCWVITWVQLNYCLLLTSIAITLVEVSHGKVRLLDAYWPVTDIITLKEKRWTEVSSFLVQAS
jgi:hypothetical protein